MKRSDLFAVLVTTVVLGSCIQMLDASSVGTFANELARRDMSLPVPTDGGSGSWATQAKGWRRVLHGPFGLPSDLYVNKQLNTSSLIRTYVPSLLFMFLALMCGMTILPISSCICCCCLRSKRRRKMKGPSPIRTTCGFVTVFCVFICALCAFFGAIGAGTILANSLVDLANGIQAVVADTNTVAVKFPATIESAMTKLEAGVNISCDSTGTAVDYTSLRTQLGGPSIGSGLGNDAVSLATQGSTAVTTINTAVTTIQSNLKDMTSLISQVQTLTAAFSAVNGPFTSGGTSFQPAAALTFSSSNLNNLITSYQSQMATIQAAITSEQSTQAPLLKTYGTGLSDIVSYWTDIGVTIQGALNTRVKNTKNVIIPSLHGFTQPTIQQSHSTSDSLVSSITGFQTTLDGIFGTKSGGGLRAVTSAISKIVPMFLTFTFILCIVLVVFVCIRLVFAMPILLWIISFVAAVMMVLGAILFLLAVIMGDVCAIVDNQNAGGLAGLNPDLSKSAANFFTARQKDCIDNDNGLVQLAIDIGLVTQDQANLTEIAKPTVNGFDLSLLTQLYAAEMIPPSSTSFKTDVLTSVSTGLTSGFTMSAVGGDATLQTSSGNDLTTFKTSVQTILTNMQSNQASASVDSDFTASVTYAQAWAAAGPTFTTGIANINKVISLMTQLKADVDSMYAQITAINQATSTLATVGPALPPKYNSVSTTLTAFAATASAQLTKNVPNIRYLMLKAINDAEVQFFAGFPCKDIGHDTLVIEKAMCAEFLSPLDAIWYSFLVGGFAFCIAIYSYGIIVNRSMAPDRFTIYRELADKNPTTALYAKRIEELNAQLGATMIVYYTVVMTKVGLSKGGATTANAKQVHPEPQEKNIVASAPVEEIQGEV